MGVTPTADAKMAWGVLVFAAMSTSHYSASQAILDAHALPRWGGATNLITPAVYGSAFVSAVGSSPADALRSNPYLLGVLAPGAALIAAGVLVFLIFFLAYCCACCRCCGACRPRHKASASCSLLSRTTLLALIAVLNLGLLLSALAYVPGFGNGLGGIVGSMQSVAALMTTGAALLTSPAPVAVPGGAPAAASVATQVAAAAATASSMATAVCNNFLLNTTSPDSCRQFTSLSSYVASLGGEVTAPAGVLSDAAGRLTSTLASWPVEQIKGTVTLAGLCVLAIISGLLFLQSMLICRCRCASYSFKLLSFLSLVLATLVYVLAGVFLVVGMLGSDLCFSPYAQVASLSAPIDPTLTLNYYLTCYGTSASPPSGSVPAALLNVSAATAQYATQLNTSVFQDPFFVNAVNQPIGISGFSANATALLAGFAGIAATLAQLPTAVLSCNALDGVFSSFFNGFCGGAINSSVSVARILIAAASLLLLQLALVTDFACYHPGDPTAFDAGAGGGGGKDLHLRSTAAAQPFQQRNSGYTV